MADGCLPNTGLPLKCFGPTGTKASKSKIYIRFNHIHDCVNQRLGMIRENTFSSSVETAPDLLFIRFVQIVAHIFKQNICLLIDITFPLIL